MDTNRIREIHKGTAYPESRSVYQALLQVWNECEQEKQMNKGKIIDADKLKEKEKESNYCTCGNKSNCSTHNGLISVCYDCRKPIKEDRPTGLIPELEKRVEVIEQKLKDLSNG